MERGEPSEVEASSDALAQISKKARSAALRNMQVHHEIALARGGGHVVQQRVAPCPSLLETSGTSLLSVQFRVEGLGFRVQSSEFRVWGSGFRV